MKNSDDSHASDSSDLEFPDWSGLVERRTTLPVEAVFVLCEEYVGYFPKAFQERRKRRVPKDIVPFEL